jgi:2-dehydropantoate 2-reductase
VVLGAGAVGGTVGGRLVDAGHDVLLVARGEHGRALRTAGLRLATPDRLLQLDVEVCASAADVGWRADDVALVATKTQDTVGALAAVPADVAVCCVQNSVANERIALRRHDNVYGVVVMLPAALTGPGRIDAQGAPHSGLLDIGRFPAGTDDVAEQVAADLTSAGFVSRAVADVMRWKHAKLLRNLDNAVEALVGVDAMADPALAPVHAALRAEAEAALRAAGNDWATDAEWTERRGEQVQWRPVEGRDRTGGSSWQSLDRGAASIETDYLNGEIVLLGRLYGVPTPYNAAVQRLAAAAVRAGARPGAMSAAELVAGCVA